MTAQLVLGAFALGVLGSAHCAAMCGGFARSGAGAAWPLHAGRIGSYAIAGAVAGAAGAAPAAWVASEPLRFAAFALACAVLFASGLRLGGFLAFTTPPAFARGFGRLAAAAAPRIGPPGTTPRRLLLGALWGWAPCALVYAALPIAWVSGSPAGGALAMAAFGAGTVPALLGAGWVLARVGERSRRFAGALLMGLAVVALATHAARDGAFCAVAS
jgi:sulfite exporter TauE/SafE